MVHEQAVTALEALAAGPAVAPAPCGRGWHVGRSRPRGHHPPWKEDHMNGGMSRDTPVAPAGVAHAAGGGAGAVRGTRRGVSRPRTGREPARVPAPPSPSRGTPAA